MKYLVDRSLHSLSLVFPPVLRLMIAMAMLMLALSALKLPSNALAATRELEVMVCRLIDSKQVRLPWL